MRDFTKVGKPEESEVAGTAKGLERNRRVIANAVYGSALMFGVGGAWLLFGEQSFLPPDMAKIMGIAFIVAAAMDVLAVALMKKFWARDMRR